MKLFIISEKIRYRSCVGWEQVMCSSKWVGGRVALLKCVVYCGRQHNLWYLPKLVHWRGGHCNYFSNFVAHDDFCNHRSHFLVNSGGNWPGSSSVQTGCMILSFFKTEMRSRGMFSSNTVSAYQVNLASDDIFWPSQPEAKNFSLLWRITLMKYFNA